MKFEPFETNFSIQNQKNRFFTPKNRRNNEKNAPKTPETPNFSQFFAPNWPKPPKNDQKTRIFIAISDEKSQKMTAEAEKFRRRIAGNSKISAFFGPGFVFFYI
jgi:hypothetical protein